MSKLTIRTLGHAGLELECGGRSIQMDPWMCPDGAFQASWFQWPDNSHLIDRLSPPNAVVISHEHLDHVDPWWLSRLPRATPVFVPKYPLSALKEKVQASGLSPIEVAPWREFEPAAGIRAFFVTERSPMNHDAGIVVMAEGKVILNANDARLCPLQLREIRGKVGQIDLMALQGSGASWYPMAYDYCEEKQKSLARRKRMAKFAYVAQAIRAAAPAMVLPFAGPPAFLDPALFHINDQMDEGIFPDHEQVAGWLKTEGFDNVRFLYPGDCLELPSGAIDRDAHWRGFSYKDRAVHLREYADRRASNISRVLAAYAQPERDLWPDFCRYFEDLLAFSPYFNDRIGMKVGFHITGPGGGEWSVDFRGASRGVDRTMEGASYIFRFESRWLPPILSGRVPWEDFLLSCRLRAWRDPDVYNDHLLGLLKFASRDALAAVEEWEQSSRNHETIDVRSKAGTFRIPRYCPHAGQDLLEVGEVLPGDVFRCNGHHFEFDLKTGRCLTGNTDIRSSLISRG